MHFSTSTFLATLLYTYGTSSAAVANVRFLHTNPDPEEDVDICATD